MRCTERFGDGPPEARTGHPPPACKARTAPPAPRAPASPACTCRLDAEKKASGVPRVPSWITRRRDRRSRPSGKASGPRVALRESWRKRSRSLAKRRVRLQAARNLHLPPWLLHAAGGHGFLPCAESRGACSSTGCSVVSATSEVVTPGQCLGHGSACVPPRWNVPCFLASDRNRIPVALRARACAFHVGGKHRESSHPVSAISLREALWGCDRPRRGRTFATARDRPRGRDGDSHRGFRMRRGPEAP